jgi:hypothetical protein
MFYGLYCFSFQQAEKYRLIFLQESGDQSPKRPHRPATQAKNRGGNQIQNRVFPKHDGMGNGILHDVHPDVIQSKMETKKDKVMTHCTLFCHVRICLWEFCKMIVIVSC